MDDTDEYGNREGQLEKIKNGSLESLTKFVFESLYNFIDFKKSSVNSYHSLKFIIDSHAKLGLELFL